MDVTIAGEGMQNSVLCSVPAAFEQDDIFVELYLLGYRTSV